MNVLKKTVTQLIASLLQGDCLSSLSTKSKRGMICLHAHFTKRCDMFADPLYNVRGVIYDIFAGSLYKEMRHVCRLTVQRVVSYLQTHFTKRYDMFADPLYKEMSHVCRPTLQRGMTCLQTHCI